MSMACARGHIRVVLPVATFILAALVLKTWSQDDWPRPYLTAFFAWCLNLAYGEIGNLVCQRSVRVRDGLDALSVQMFVASAQSLTHQAPVRPRVRYDRVMLWGIALAALLWLVWRHDPVITVNPCVSTITFVMVGRRDALALASVLGCVPVAWQMQQAWCCWASALRGLAAILWLACCVATPPWLQCAVFAALGTGCHPGLLVAGLVGRRAPRVLPALGLGVGAL